MADEATGGTSHRAGRQEPERSTHQAQHAADDDAGDDGSSVSTDRPAPASDVTVEPLAYDSHAHLLVDLARKIEGAVGFGGFVEDDRHQLQCVRVVARRTELAARRHGW